MKPAKKKRIAFSDPLIPANETIKAIKKVINSNFPNEAKFTRLFEKKASKLLNVRYSVACTSGTAAIFLALKSLGLKRNDEILVPNITFAATINAIKLLEAKPILVDVNKENLLMDLIDLKRKINNKTKAILPVHVSGRGSNIQSIKKIAKNKKIYLVEDAAEAFMSKLDKDYYGTFGQIGCFSFAPNKIITTGQGGLVVTNDLKIYKKLLLFKNQGRVGKTSGGGDDRYLSAGFNFKITDLQAALGLVQMKTLNNRIKKLKYFNNFYKKNLIQNKNFKLFNFDISRGEIPLWSDVYCIKTAKLLNYLKKNNIHGRSFWKPINTCEPYKQSFRGLKNSKLLFNKLMWLPSSQNINLKDLKNICELINKFIKKNLS